MGQINIPDKATFELEMPDKIKISTQTNGDRVTMFPHFTPEQAASISYLANASEGILEVTIKLKGT